VSGYVRIHRTLIGHPAFRNDAEAMAFAWMVARAAWKPTRVRYKERGICLARGQLAISQRDMARDMDRDKAWVERLWKRLRAEAMIEVDSEAGVAVITICNYAEYQADSPVLEAVAEAPRKADARQTQGTEQRREEGKKGSSEPKGSSPRPKFPAPEGVSDSVWLDFLNSPKRKKAGMSPTAYSGILNNLNILAEHGFPPGEMIALAVERGWTTVKLEWVLNDDRQRNSNQRSMGGPRPDPTLEIVRAAMQAQR